MLLSRSHTAMLPFVQRVLHNLLSAVCISYNLTIRNHIYALDEKVDVPEGTVNLVDTAVCSFTPRSGIHVCPGRTLYLCFELTWFCVFWSWVLAITNALCILESTLGNHPWFCVFWSWLLAITNGFVYFEADSWQSPINIIIILHIWNLSCFAMPIYIRLVYSRNDAQVSFHGNWIFLL
jgi:hypothetical protein